MKTKMKYRIGQEIGDCIITDYDFKTKLYKTIGRAISGYCLYKETELDRLSNELKQEEKS